MPLHIKHRVVLGSRAKFEKTFSTIRGTSLVSQNLNCSDFRNITLFKCSISLVSWEKCFAKYLSLLSTCLTKMVFVLPKLV